jgi:hypothetical protein
MAFRGSTRNLREYEKRLRKVASVATGERIAELGAQALTAELQRDFAAGNDAYGGARPDGFHGPVTLVRKGTLRSFLKFAATGRRIRVVLSVPYAKFMIGRFNVLPRGGSAIPFRWAEKLDAIAKRVLGETLAGGA